MKLGLGLYRDILTAENVRFAKQCGATHIVAHIPGNFTKGKKIITSDLAGAGFGYSDGDDPIWSYEGLRDLKAMVNSEGMELEALENFAPAHWYDVLLDGPKKKQQMEHLKQIIRDVGRVGIPIMGYCFTVAGTWGRTEAPRARGKSMSVGFDNPVQPPIPAGMVWNMVYDADLFDADNPKGVVPPVSAQEIWQRFGDFVGEMMPVAEEAGVKLALHPDDPPLPALRGASRLVYSQNDYQRVLDLSSSPANTMEFCVGTLSEMPNADIYDMVDRYSKTGRIGYVHFRNVQGKAPNYHEMWIDDGDTDMIRVMEILKRNQFDGVLIPDHTPLLNCEGPWHAGMAYTLGYMKAVLAMLER